MTQSLKLIGYWQGWSSKQWPHPRTLVDPDWMAAERHLIVVYLRSGCRIHEDLGYSFCRFANGPPDEAMGNADLTDGTWVWPEGLYVYVDQFDIRLPDEFMDDMRKNKFRIPDDLDANALEELPVSTDFWKAWYSQNVRREGTLRRSRSGCETGSPDGSRVTTRI